MKIIFIMSWAKCEHPEIGDKNIIWFDFFPLMNIEHKTERSNAFVTLAFAFPVVALLFQKATPYGINAFYRRAVSCLIQAFALSRLLPDIELRKLHSHSIRRHVVYGMVRITARLPFVYGISKGTGGRGPDMTSTTKPFTPMSNP